MRIFAQIQSFHLSYILSLLFCKCASANYHGTNIKKDQALNASKMTPYPPPPPHTHRPLEARRGEISARFSEREATRQWTVKASKKLSHESRHRYFSEFCAIKFYHTFKSQIYIFSLKILPYLSFCPDPRPVSYHCPLRQELII
jgi:hypothetical protein